MKFLVRTFKQSSTPLLILFVLLSRLFVYRGIDWNGALGGGLGNILYFLLAIVMLKECYGTKRIIKGNIYRGVVLLSVVFVGSIIIAFVNEGQSFYYSFKGLCSYAYVPVLLYFYLNAKQVDNNTLIRTLVVLFLIYLIIYAYSYAIFPDYCFGMVSNIEEGLLNDFENRGVFRTGIPYEDLITIFFLYVVSNKLENRHRLMLFFFLLFLTVIRGTRFIIAGTFLLGFLLYLKQAKGNILRSFLGLLIVILIIYMYFQIAGVPSFLENYIELSQKDQESGEENIRVLMTMHYLFNFDASWTEILFGHGLAVKSSFADIKQNLTQYGFYADDVGYVEFYLYFGILGIAGLFYLLYSVVKTKVPRQFLFAKYYIYYIFVTMLCGRYLLNNMALFVTMLYLIEHNKIVLSNKSLWKK